MILNTPKYLLIFLSSILLLGACTQQSQQASPPNREPERTKQQLIIKQDSPERPIPVIKLPPEIIRPKPNVTRPNSTADIRTNTAPVAVPLPTIKLESQEDDLGVCDVPGECQLTLQPGDKHKLEQALRSGELEEFKALVRSLHHTYGYEYSAVDAIQQELKIIGSQNNGHYSKLAKQLAIAIPSRSTVLSSYWFFQSKPAPDSEQVAIERIESGFQAVNSHYKKIRIYEKHESAIQQAERFFQQREQADPSFRSVQLESLFHNGSMNPNNVSNLCAFASENTLQPVAFLMALLSSPHDSNTIKAYKIIFENRLSLGADWTRCETIFHASAETNELTHKLWTQENHILNLLRERKIGVDEALKEFEKTLSTLTSEHAFIATDVDYRILMSGLVTRENSRTLGRLLQIADLRSSEPGSYLTHIKMATKEMRLTAQQEQVELVRILLDKIKDGDKNDAIESLKLICSQNPQKADIYCDSLASVLHKVKDFITPHQKETYDKLVAKVDASRNRYFYDFRGPSVSMEDIVTELAQEHSTARH